MTRAARRPALGLRLAASLAALAAPISGCTVGEQESPTWGLTREQPRADPWEASKVLPGGSVMQSPPRGTVPWLSVPIEPRLDPRDLAAAHTVGEIPLPVTADLLALGGNRFAIFCAVCHGAGGYGGSVVASNMVTDLPPSLRTPEMLAHEPAHVYVVIRNGQGRMPSYATRLGVHERWAVVAYLRELQRRPPVTEAERIDSARAESMRRRRGGTRAPGSPP